MGLTLNELAERMHVENALQLHNLFLGRAIGAVFGTWADLTPKELGPSLRGLERQCARDHLRLK